MHLRYVQKETSVTTFQIIVLFTTSNSKMALLLLRNNARNHFHVKNVRFVSQAMKLVNEKLDLELDNYNLIQLP